MADLVRLGRIDLRAAEIVADVLLDVVDAADRVEGVARVAVVAAGAVQEAVVVDAADAKKRYMEFKGYAKAWPFFLARIIGERSFAPLDGRGGRPPVGAGGSLFLHLLRW